MRHLGSIIWLAAVAAVLGVAWLRYRVSRRAEAFEKEMETFFFSSKPRVDLSDMPRHPDHATDSDSRERFEAMCREIEAS